MHVWHYAPRSRPYSAAHVKEIAHTSNIVTLLHQAIYFQREREGDATKPKHLTPTASSSKDAAPQRHSSGKIQILVKTKIHGQRGLPHGSMALKSGLALEEEQRYGQGSSEGIWRPELDVLNVGFQEDVPQTPTEPQTRDRKET